MRAAYNGHNGIVDTLLKHGAKPDTPNKDGDTALSLAESKGYTLIVDLLNQPNTGTSASEDRWGMRQVFCQSSVIPAKARIHP